MNKNLIRLAVLLGAVLSAGALCASPQGKASASGEQLTQGVQPVYLDGGNTRKPISVAMSTLSAVLISSSADNFIYHEEAPHSTDTITGFRARTIVNCSTTGALALFPTDGYDSFSSTYSIVLGTGTNGLGDSYTTHDQAAIWGVWDGTHTNGAPFPLPGACGEEQFYIGKRPPRSYP